MMMHGGCKVKRDSHSDLYPFLLASIEKKLLLNLPDARVGEAFVRRHFWQNVLPYIGADKERVDPETFTANQPISFLPSQLDKGRQ